MTLTGRMQETIMEQMLSLIPELQQTIYFYILILPYRPVFLLQEDLCQLILLDYQMEQR
jgi:hypothetical protein